MSPTEYLAQHPDLAQAFHQGMGTATESYTSAIMEAYDFSTIKQIVAVSGADRRLLVTILQDYPHIQGILYDQAHAIDEARHQYEEAGVIDRCKLMVGDFFESVPTGDAYLITTVNRWNYQNATKILQNCHQAMDGEGRILFIERVISPDTPWRLRFEDLNMLVQTAGRIRTEEEFRNLFEAGGFQLTRVIPTESLMSVIEGVPMS